jgi:hypothetical protein
MKFQKLGIILFGIIEIIIGSVTFVALMASLVLGKSTKPLEIFLFVLTTSLISSGLGIGIIRHNLHSFHMLLFFSAAIILSKFLAFANIIYFNGALETSISPCFKSICSIIYHGLLLVFLTRPSVRKQFYKTIDF